jgi:hypothetical protein
MKGCCQREGNRGHLRRGGERGCASSSRRASQEPLFLSFARVRCGYINKISPRYYMGGTGVSRNPSATPTSTTHRSKGVMARICACVRAEIIHRQVSQFTTEHTRGEMEI